MISIPTAMAVLEKRKDLFFLQLIKNGF